MKSLTQGVFTSTTFNNIIRSTGNGTAINLDLTPASTDDIILSGMTFNSCISSAGYGGALYLNLLSKPNSLKIDSETVTFLECSAGKGLGMNMFITASIDVLDLFSKDAFPVASTFTETDLDLFWIEEIDCPTRTTRIPFSISLLYLLFPPKDKPTITTAYLANTLYTRGGATVRAGGVDTSTCGWEELPCLTISAAVNNSASLFLSMSEGTHGAEGESVTLSTDTTILGGAAVAKQVGDLSSVDAHYIISAEVHFNTISFSLPATLSNTLINATY